MNNRRSFIKKVALSSIILGQNQLNAHSSENRSAAKIISTWSHGMDANKIGLEIIENGGSAIDAVEKGVNVVENDPESQTVGLGGFPDKDGIVTLDACIMKGDGSCGSVAFLQDIQNPISVARKVMEETRHIMLVGKGAKKFALEKGFTETNLLTEKSKADYLKWLEKSDYIPNINIENHDTISTLALDQNGDLAGACTTSGAAWKLHGRVGDSPIIGAGLFVDNEVGAAAATGWGEAVIRTVGSALVVEGMRNGLSPKKACIQAVKRIQQKHATVEDLQVGFIAIDKYGTTGAYCIQPGFNYAIGENGKHKLIDSESLVSK